jgi:protein arginine kinase activator
MICQICKKSQATIHVTQQKNDKVVKIHMCRHCAEDKGFDYFEKSNFAMGNLISGLLSRSPVTGRASKHSHACPTCGTSYDEFKEIAKLGCSECYEFFKIQLLPVLRNLHVKTQHLGKFPLSRGDRADRVKKITLLEEELERAVQDECYERAAQLRDEIKRIEADQETGGEPCRP